MPVSGVKYLSICLVTGLAVGLTVYLYFRRRNQTDTISGSEKTSTERDKTSLEKDVPTDDIAVSDHTLSSDLSSSSSLEMCSSSFSDTSIDENVKCRRTNRICGLDIEDESYSEDVNPRTFDIQLNSPIVVMHTDRRFPLQTHDGIGVSTENSVSIVPDFPDTYTTLAQTMDHYNKIVKPNSPLTAKYIR